jgi:hypothetical protein
MTREKNLEIPHNVKLIKTVVNRKKNTIFNIQDEINTLNTSKGMSFERL